MRAASCKAGERTRARPWVLMFERISCCALAPWLGAHGVTRDYDLGFRRPGLMRGDRQALARRGPGRMRIHTYSRARDVPAHSRGGLRPLNT